MSFFFHTVSSCKFYWVCRPSYFRGNSFRIERHSCRVGEKCKVLSFRMRKPDLQKQIRSISVASKTYLRCILRHKGCRPVRCDFIHPRRALQHPHQIVEWIQPVLLRCLNHAEYNCTALGPVGRVGKQEILSVHYEWLYTAFGAVVGNFQSSIFRITNQPGPLLPHIMQCFYQRRLRRCFLRYCTCQ